MSLRFRPLFTLSLNHDYYAGACADFEFVTPSATAALLRNGRILTRVLDGRLHALFEADALGAPRTSLAGGTLAFGLRLTNPYFDNFTMPVVSDTTRTPLYTNRTDPATLDAASGVSLAGGLHTHAPASAARPLVLRLHAPSGALIDQQLLQTGDASGSFDLRTLPDGAYRIDEDTGGGGIASSPLYLSAELRGAGVWGMLAIQVDAGFYATPAAFSLKFAARQEPLKYFVVARNFTPAEFDQLQVDDNGFGEEGRARLDFDKVLPAAFSDADIAPALLGDADSRIAKFQSQLPVARRARGLRKLQLHRNGEVLVEHLPQPGADRSQAHLIIHLSKP